MSKCRSTLITAAVGTLLASAARIYVISKTDMNSGILIHGEETLCNLLYFGAVMLTAVVCALIRIKDKSYDASELDGRGAVIIGFGLLAAAFFAGNEGVGELSAFSPSGFLIFVDFIFAVLLGIVAFVTLYLKEFKPWLGFIYALGGVYCALRGVNVFGERMVVTAVPEYLINCLIVIAAAVFFLMTARMLSGNAGKLTNAAFFGFGTGAGVLAFSAYIGGGIAKLILPSEISDRIVFSASSAEYFYQALHGRDAYQLAFPSMADAALGIFAFAAITAVCLGRKADS